MQLDDLDFTDDLALLSHTQQQMQEKTTSEAAASAAEKRKTKEHITPRNGNRHEKDELELDGIRIGGPGQSGLENAGLCSIGSNRRKCACTEYDDAKLLTKKNRINEFPKKNSTGLK
ncbi:unnamed protein product [Schistosoma margrebowiei]|uniref:Uncharacterized protein n=1 Tax=Schistosoma margrebowiei TaxID=48269 RepID=A0A183MRF4_9TREM|nr:unnamed protein product [Schistosoma margrebowiei]